MNRTGLGATGVMRADEHGRVRERGDHRYFYGASGNRTYVYDAATETVVAQSGAWRRGRPGFIQNTGRSETQLEHELESYTGSAPNPPAEDEVPDEGE